jgi:hypothetical protein
MDLIKKSVVLVLAGLLLWSCSTGLTPEQLREKYGTNPPKIVKYGAAEKVFAGRTWRVYVSAKDLDGDMDAIRFEIKQPGQGIKNRFFKISDPTMTHSFTGYFYLHTPTLSPRLDNDFLFNTLRLKMKIFDKANHKSDEITIFFSIVSASVDQPIPSNFSADENRALGPITIRLTRTSNKRLGITP